MQRNRLSLARELLSQLGYDALLITDTIEATYLCGFKASHIALIVQDKSATLITDFRYAEAAQAHCELYPEWSFRQMESSLFETIAKILKKCSSIGFQDTYLTVAQYSLLQNELPLPAFHPAGKEITNLFSTKTEAEISAIERAANIADQAYEKLLPNLQVGISEYDTAQKLDAIAQNLGSETPSFNTIVLFGERSALPHGTPSKKRLLNAGDWVLIDFGCTIDGFCSDMTRTAVFGKASPEQRELYATVLKAQTAGKEHTKAGIQAREADAVVRDIIEKAGYGEAFGHGTGHGVGRRIHEVPALNKKNETILKEGMAVTIEPGVYLPGFGGVRIEDLVVITTNGIQCLSKTPRTLREIG